MDNIRHQLTPELDARIGQTIAQASELRKTQKPAGNGVPGLHVDGFGSALGARAAYSALSDAFEQHGVGCVRG